MVRLSAVKLVDVFPRMHGGEQTLLNHALCTSLGSINYKHRETDNLNLNIDLKAWNNPESNNDEKSDC